MTAQSIAVPKVVIGGTSGLYLATLNAFANTVKPLVFAPGFPGQNISDLTATLNLFSSHAIITLTEEDGLTKLLNEASRQEFEFTLSTANKFALLGVGNTATVRWELSVTLPGGVPLAGSEGTAYAGLFFIKDSTSIASGTSGIVPVLIGSGAI